MEVDPTASMQIWAVDLELGGRVFEIPALPAADWLPVLMSGRTVTVLDMVNDPDGVDDVIATGQAGPEEIRDGVNAVIEQMAGRDLHAATVIAQAAALRWEIIGGDLARRGVRLDQISLGAALDALYATIAQGLKPEALERFRAALEPSTQSRRPPRANRRAAESQFEDMAGPKPAPVPVKATGGPSGGGRPKTRQQLRQRPRADR